MSFNHLQVHLLSGYDVPCSALHHIQQRVQAEVRGPLVHNIPNLRTVVIKLILKIQSLFERISNQKSKFCLLNLLSQFCKNLFSSDIFLPSGLFRYPRGPQPIPPPPPPPPPLEKEDPSESAKRKSEFEEKPLAKVLKTEASGSEYCRFNQVWAETYDRPLPSELLLQCRPLMCDLCSVKLNSPVQAK